MRYLPTVIAAAFAIGLAAAPARAGRLHAKVDCLRDLRRALDHIEENWSFGLFMSTTVDLEEVLKELEPKARRAKTPPACADLIGRFLAKLSDGHARVLSMPGLVRTAPPIVIRSQRERVSRVAGAPPLVHAYIFARDTTDEAVRSIPRGCEIESVNGTPLARLYERVRETVSGSTDQWRDYRTDQILLAGPPGSRVELSYRAPSGATGSVTLVRPTPESMELQSARLQAQLGRAAATSAKRLQGGWGYVRIGTFELGTRERTLELLDQALASVSDAPGLIIDLRGNDSGPMAAASALAGRFVAERATIGYFSVRAPGQREVPTVTDEISGGVTSRPPLLASPTGEVYAGPVVILVDRGCFGACEAFAGGLQAIGRALLIGPEASGGGSGPDRVFELPSGATIAFSTSVAWLPDAEPLEGRGVTPDVLLRERARDWAVGRDRVLERAIRALTQGEAKPLRPPPTES